MFWDLLTADEKQIVAAAGVRKQYSSGAMLFRDGDEPTHALVVLSGLVKLTTSSMTGREVLIELRGSGDVVGELGPVRGDPRNASATVVEPVDTIVIPAEAFRRLLTENGSIAYVMLKVVALKLQQATSRRLEARSGDAQARLCGRLVELAASGTVGPDGVIELTSPLTQQELGEWIGISRDAVVLALRRIRGLGWIETGRRSIRIINLEALRQASAE